MWLGCGADRPESGAEALSFNRDIAPIIFQHCSGCHRPGESAPFSLLTYTDVKRRARLVADVTQKRYMPPWKPEPGYGDFVGVRRLGEAQIGRIQRWVDEGALEGEPADLPPQPEWPKGWQLGQPDLVVEMTEAYSLQAGGGDVFRNFVIPLPLSEPRHVVAVELRPGNPRIVHHGVIMFDRSGAARKRDVRDPGPGFEGMDFGEAFKPDGHFLGWAPGTMPFAVPDSLAWTAHPGTDLVLMLHLLPSGKPEPIKAKAGFFFSDEPPTRTPTLLRLSRKDIDLPAGAPSVEYEDTYELPVDVQVLSVFPHAHYLGKTIEALALLPGGDRKWLIRIDDWDFDWQDYYRYARPVFLPGGTTLVMRHTYDNSSANVRNPSDPPRRVLFGVRSSDEMGDLVLQVLPSSEADLDTLKRDFSRKWLQQEIAGYETMLEVDPDNAGYQFGLGSLHLAAGDADSALPRLEAALRIEPDYTDAHLSVAIVQATRRQFAVAQKHLRRALELRPDLAEAHYNLAMVFGQRGEIDSALSHFDTAARLRPGRAAEIHEIAARLADRRSP